jgi:hypothetical protein
MVWSDVMMLTSNAILALKYAMMIEDNATKILNHTENAWKDVSPRRKTQTLLLARLPSSQTEGKKMV